ncbi:hypothetical protein Tco_0983186 [Tanacetum coccineum]
MKTPATSKKNVTEKPTSDEYDDEHEERLIRRKPTGVVIRDTPNVSTKKTLDQSKKLKEVPDEPKGKTATKDDEWGSDEEEIILSSDDERTDDEEELHADDDAHDDENVHDDDKKPE